jgi:putative PIN family toxin of toxin-antitoxin system
VIRVLLDTNVLAPGFVGQGSASTRLIDLWRDGAYDLVVSDHLLQELARTFTDRYYARRVPRADTEAILLLLGARAIVATLTADVQGVASHPEDDLVLTTAISGNASMICTRDKQLLKLGRYQNVEIVLPGALLALLSPEHRPLS